MSSRLSSRPPPSRTPQVVDRPTQGHRFLSRKYLQPQWVLDSANFRVLMPAELYVPGRVPPPHLSPFVNDDEEGYTPDFAATVKRLQVGGGRLFPDTLEQEGGREEVVGIASPHTFGHHCRVGDKMVHTYSNTSWIHPFVDPPSGIGHAASLCGSTNESLLGRVTLLRWALHRPHPWPAVTPMGADIQMSDFLPFHYFLTRC